MTQLNYGHCPSLLCRSAPINLTRARNRTFPKYGFLNMKPEPEVGVYWQAWTLMSLPICWVTYPDNITSLHDYWSHPDNLNTTSIHNYWSHQVPSWQWTHASCGQCQGGCHYIALPRCKVIKCTLRDPYGTEQNHTECPSALESWKIDNESQDNQFSNSI